MKNLVNPQNFRSDQSFRFNLLIINHLGEKTGIWNEIRAPE